MFAQINELIKVIDDAVWGLPLICLIMVTGILLTVRLGGVQASRKSFQIYVSG